jgi:hypothetical protein
MARSAKGKPARRTRRTGSARSHTPARRSVKRPSKKAQPKRSSAAAPSIRKKNGKRAAPTRSAKAAGSSKATSAKRTPMKRAIARKAAPRKSAARSRTLAAGNRAEPAKQPRLDRVRRTLEETVPTPPSSLDMNRRGSAARTGRAEMADSRDEHRGMSTSIAGGDADVDIENAYFTGDEAPGGDNPAPDEEVVDDIGKALGVQYDDQEELKSSDKIIERDKHRWEMDPASSEDYKDRK